MAHQFTKTTTPFPTPCPVPMNNPCVTVPLGTNKQPMSRRISRYSSLYASLSARTSMSRPSSSTSCNSLIARDASAAFENSTMPQPLERPSGLVHTSALTTSPTLLNTSFNSCQATFQDRFPTKTRVPPPPPPPLEAAAEAEAAAAGEPPPPPP